MRDIQEMINKSAQYDEEEIREYEMAMEWEGTYPKTRQPKGTEEGKRGRDDASAEYGKVNSAKKGNVKREEYAITGEGKAKRSSPYQTKEAKELEEELFIDKSKNWKLCS